MTNSEFNKDLLAFEKQVHEEGFNDIYFQRYSTYGGDWGIKCVHTDYQEPCFYSGTFGDFEEKIIKVKEMFEYYVRYNPKYI